MADPFLTRAETVAWLDIEPGETAALAAVPGVIQAATDALVDYMGRDPRTNDYVEWKDGNGSPALAVKNYPIQAVTSVEIDGMASSLQGVTWDDVLIYRAGRWPRGQRNIRVSYTAGLDDLPGSVKQAALFTAKAIWLARPVDQNTTGESFQGVMSSSFVGTGAGAVPPSARDLVRGYMNRWNG